MTRPQAQQQQNIETSQAQITLNGVRQNDLELHNLVDVIVEQDLFLPDALTLRFIDIKDTPSTKSQGFFKLLDEDKFRIGASIKVGLAAGTQTPRNVFDGEITSVELDLDGGAVPELVVRGFDKSHRMRREKKTKAYVESTDSDIVRRIASSHGLTCTADATTVVYPHVFQDNLTDWDFLRVRAARIGYDIFTRGSALHFRKHGADTTVILAAYGETLFRVRVRMAAQSQVSNVAVRGWDPKQKQPLTAEASSVTQSSAQIGERKTGARLGATMGTGKYVETEPTVITQADATNRAKAIYDRIAGDLLQVDGLCVGNTALRPGTQINLTKIGTRLSGKYFVSSVTHRKRRGDPYTSSFVVNGQRPATLTSMVSASHNGHAVASAGARPSVVVGVVTSLSDPDSLGRVKVKFPWLDGQQQSSTQGVASAWARIAAPMAGNQRGFLWLPEVNDEVLVAFEHGDINHPYVLGGLWNGIDKPPEPNRDGQAVKPVGATGKVERRFIQTRRGHTVLLDDSETTPAVVVKSKAGHSITLDDATASPSVVVKTNGGHTVKLDDAAATKSITITDTPGNSIKIDTKTNTISIKSNANLNMEATGALSIKGASVTIEANAAFTLKGSGSAPSIVQSNGPLIVKGNPVNIN